MCPDRQILSLYFDEELPSPWKEKMETHIGSCEKCQSDLAKYHRLRAVLEGDRIAVSEELKSRVWDKTVSGTAEGLNNFIHARRKEFAPVKERHVFWNRSVSLPFPAAVAAAAVFILVAFLALQGIRSPGTAGIQEPGIVAGIGTGVQGIVPAPDMNSLFQYLSMEAMSDFVIIQLPETTSFSSSGEPALLRAADYSRRISSR